MPLPLSRSQVDKLGDRLRSAASDDDLDRLQVVIGAHQEALEEVASNLRRLGFAPTTRLKTWQTTVEKLQRERARLSQIQDIAGARLIVDNGRYEQDEVVAALQAHWPTARIVDRRRNPSSGYRAVHVIVTASQCAVEIQVRTQLQDLWAQVVESVADRFGRAIRYGLWDTLPTELDGLRTAMQNTSERIANHEMSEQYVQIFERLTEDQRNELLTQNDAASRLIRAEEYLEANRESMDAMAEALKALAATIKELEMD